MNKEIENIILNKEKVDEILKYDERVVTNNYDNIKEIFDMGEFCKAMVENKESAKIIASQGLESNNKKELTLKEQLDILCPTVIKNALVHRLDAINTRDNRDYNKYSNRYYLLRSAIEEAERQSALEPEKKE